MSFRSETFREYAKTYRPSSLFLVIFIGSILFSFGFSFFMETYAGGFLLLMPLFLVFSYYQSYRIYKLGNTLASEKSYEKLKIIENLNVWIEDELPNARKSVYLSRTPIYEFEKADLIISEQSIYVLGKTHTWGSTIHVAPIEIATPHYLGSTSFGNVELFNWKLRKKVVTLCIQDKAYPRLIYIKIRLKDKLMIEWLENNYPNTTKK